MNITKSQLKQLIKEEIQILLNEQPPIFDPAGLKRTKREIPKGFMSLAQAAKKAEKEAADRKRFGIGPGEPILSDEEAKAAARAGAGLPGHGRGYYKAGDDAETQAEFPGYFADEASRRTPGAGEEFPIPDLDPGGFAARSTSVTAPDDSPPGMNPLAWMEPSYGTVGPEGELIPGDPYGATAEPWKAKWGKEEAAKNADLVAKIEDPDDPIEINFDFYNFKWVDEERRIYGGIDKGHDGLGVTSAKGDELARRFGPRRVAKSSTSIEHVLSLLDRQKKLNLPQGYEPTVEIGGKRVSRKQLLYILPKGRRLAYLSGRWHQKTRRARGVRPPGATP